jgi:hypothetical protein
MSATDAHTRAYTSWVLWNFSSHGSIDIFAAANMLNLDRKLLWAFFLLYAVVFAAPISISIRGEEIGKRAPPGSDQSNPKDAYFDVTNWPNLSEQDCYAMLCLGKPRIL